MPKSTDTDGLDCRSPSLNLGSPHSTASPKGSSITSTRLQPSGRSPQLLEAYVSSVAELPSTVSALISSYEAVVQQSHSMCRLLSHFRAEANKLADLSPHAATVLQDILNQQSPMGIAVVTAAPHPCRPTSLSPEQDSPTTTSRAASVEKVSASVVSGTVVIGKVVGPSLQATTVASAPTPVPESASGENRNRLRRFLADVTRDYKEECIVLRTKLCAAEAAQQLLDATTMSMERLTRQKNAAEEALVATKVDLELMRAANRLLRGSSANESSEAAHASTTAEYAEDVAALTQRVDTIPQLEADVSAWRRACETSQYQEAQATKNLTACQRQLAYLTESNKQLEGQIQRLLSIEAEALNEDQKATSSTKALTSAASDQTATEKQVDELRAMVQRMSTKEKAATNSRTKLERVIAALQKENADLKASVLQYRRQVNDIELEVERSTAERADERRIRQLEKDILRARQVLQERSAEYEKNIATLQMSVARLNKVNDVHQKANVHILKELTAAQILNCRSGSDCANSTSKVMNTTQTQAPKEAVAGPSTTRADGTHSQSPHASVRTPSPQGTQADAKALEEMTLMYEHHAENTEARHRAEVRQLHRLNKELQHALSCSQEEVRAANRLLDMARVQPAGNCTITTPTLPEWPPPVSSQNASLTTSDMVGRYDPEKMSTWEAVQVENEALLNRLSTMQQENWLLSSDVEDLRLRCSSLQDELDRSARSMNQLLLSGAASPSVSQSGCVEAQLRSLQSLLQETLTEKIALEERVRSLQGSPAKRL